MAGWRAHRVQFVVNYEEGGENNILHGDAASEAFLSEIVGARPGPASATGTWNRSTNTARAPASGGCGACSPRASAGDGLWRRDRAERSPEQTAAMKEAGLGNRQPRPQMDRIQGHARGRGAPHLREAIRIHTEVTGERPSGWYLGPLLDEHDEAGHGRGRLCLLVRQLCRRPALLDRRPDGGRISSSPTPSTPTTCALRRRRASTPASSSSPT